METMYAAVLAALAAAVGPEALIRRAYTNPSPPPPEEQTVVYYHLLPDSGAAPLVEDSWAEGGKPDRFLFSGWQLQLVFYGPGAANLAWRVHHRIMLDGRGNPRQLLRAGGLYPLPRMPGPTLVWEEWQKQHRPRADLTIYLRAAWQPAEDASAGYVQYAPDVAISACGATE